MIAPHSLCLFGGTFDPIHDGHIHIAQLAHAKLKLDNVIFLPCQQSPHKLESKSASAKHRFAMCQLAIKNLTWAEVHDHDLTAPTPSYSWKTAAFFKQAYPHAKLFWLMGTDQWNALHRWSRVDYLAEMVEFIVCTRGDQTLIERSYTYHTIRTDHPASSTAIRNSLMKGTKPSWLSHEVQDYLQKAKLYLNP